ncbi:MAG: GNAT family N-acetyltransferase [Solirubrobacteraceae bacterium]
MGRFGDPEPLTEAHIVEGFDAGVASLATWLTDYALQARRAGSARTFVVTDAEQSGRVIGYHAIAAASIERAAATRLAASGTPAHPVPAILLARLAVDRSVQGRGVGAWLLQDAMRRALSASEEFGVRVLLVHAIDERARAFYERFGFEASPTDPLNLQLLIKDIRKTLGPGSA